MSDIVIRAEGLGKKYVIAHQAERERYVALRDVLARSARAVKRKAGDVVRGCSPLASDTVEEFWALTDVNFEVRRGEVLGIVGRNGAGKSTVLKILSRITEPSAGRVTISGRVASLLEVGTGFHPELTGRENIYLNGAILGMTRAEVRRKFDEIVAFAEVDKFLDTPVKRYSSGMYVRLAFAVAAHLEPEILLVDEVLAVGDAEFQKKCLGKMRQVSDQDGRTVLFVSHIMGAVRTMCSRALLLQEGHVTREGAADEIIEVYLNRGPSQGRWSWSEWDRSMSAELQVLLVELEGSRSGVAGNFQHDEELRVTLAYLQRDETSGYRFVLQLLTTAGEVAFTSTDQRYRRPESYRRGHHRTVCTIPARLLNRGTYAVRIWAGIAGVGQLIKPLDVGQFTVEGADVSGSVSDQTWPGVVAPDLRWDIVEEDSAPQLQAIG